MARSAVRARLKYKEGCRTRGRTNRASLDNTMDDEGEPAARSLSSRGHLLSELCEQIQTWTNLQTVPVEVPGMPGKAMLCHGGPALTRGPTNEEGDHSDDDEGVDDADEFYDFVRKECKAEEEEEERRCEHGPSADQLYGEARASLGEACLDYRYGPDEFLAALCLNKMAQFEELRGYVHYHGLDDATTALKTTAALLPLFTARCNGPQCIFRGVRYEGAAAEGSGRPCAQARAAEEGPCGLQGPIALPATWYRLARGASSKSRVICQLRLLNDLHRRMFLRQELPKLCLLCLAAKHNEAMSARVNGEVRPHWVPLAGLKLGVPATARQTVEEVPPPRACRIGSGPAVIRTLSPFGSLTVYRLDRLVGMLRIVGDGSGKAVFRQDDEGD